jgi:serine kinase of HPr protein (carbohydrate metabolism regulator)
MRPVTVKEILTYGERLGITEILEPPGARGSVRHLLRYAEGESGHRMTSFPHSMLIIPPAATDGAFQNGWNKSVPPSLFRNISCLALSAQRITVFLRQFSERTKTPIFSSCYDDSLLHSRLTGLLRERGERQVMVHGVLVRVWGLGVLLLGESGIGKTACGLALMGQDHRWVADDAVVLEGRGDAVYGRGHHRTAGRIAVRGRGVFRATDLLGTGRLLQEARVDALVRLVRGSERNGVQKGDSFREYTGVSLPYRDLAVDVDPRRVAERVTSYVRSLSVKSSGYAAAGAGQQR